jgi:hypothetical protein
MQRCAGSCSPQELRMLQKALDCLALSTISLTVAALCAVVLVGPGVKAVDVGQADSSQITVIYKNQLYPSIGELTARATLTEHKGQANSDEGLVFERLDQWI